MTKTELLKKFKALEDEKGVHIEGINSNINKAQIENAIKCLECSDEELDDYFILIKLKYPNTYNTIKNNGDWKHHSFNRLYVYNTAKMLLA